MNRKKWCYDTEGENSKFCTTGFPMGCYVTPQGVPKDACIISEKYRTASTFYLFNHVDITIYYHSGKGKTLKLSAGDLILNPISVGQFEGNRLVQARVIPYSFQHKKGELSCDAVNSEPMSIQNKIKEDVDITYTYSIKFEENNNVSLNYTNVIGHSSMPMINGVKWGQKFIWSENNSCHNMTF